MKVQDEAKAEGSKEDEAVAFTVSARVHFEGGQ